MWKPAALLLANQALHALGCNGYGCASDIPARQVAAADSDPVGWVARTSHTNMLTPTTPTSTHTSFKDGDPKPVVHHCCGTVPCTEVFSRCSSVRDGQKDMSAGSVPVSPRFPDTSSNAKLGRAPGSIQAAGKAGPVKKLLFNCKNSICTIHIH